MKIFFSKIVSERGFSDKLSEFSFFLAWPAILDIYSHVLVRTLFFVNAVLAWVGIRTEGAGFFLETFKVSLCQSSIEEFTFLGRKLCHCKHLNLCFTIIALVHC